MGQRLLIPLNILFAVLMTLSASAYAQDISPSTQISNVPPEKTGQARWDIQGSIGGKAVIVNARGDTSLAEIGSEIDGCLVTAGKVICDAVEKQAIKNKGVNMKDLYIVITPAPNMKALVSILESGGKTGYSPDLGGIKYAITDDRLIVRVAAGAGGRAKPVLQKAILEEASGNGYIYYVLDKNMVEVNCKRE